MFTSALRQLKKERSDDGDVQRKSSQLYKLDRSNGIAKPRLQLYDETSLEIGAITKRNIIKDIDVDIVWNNRELERASLQKFAMNFATIGDSSQQTGKQWHLTLSTLVETLTTIFGDNMVNQMCSAMFDKLAGASSDEQLQSELIDLIGIEQFDLIAMILGRRRELNNEYKSMNRASAAAASRSTAAQTRKPVPHYGQQIVVQSQLEADLQRELRREKKRQGRELNRLTHTLGDERLAIEVANIEHIRQVELNLEAAQNVPVMRDERIDAWNRHLQDVRKRPYVFDATVDQTGVNVSVGGCKFLLPESTERRDFRTYEQVHVPAMATDSIKHLARTVLVSDMDEQGRKAFAGIEKLNTIQSIVFEQAYMSNENLLICAPTGAGKTNIAMLTVLRTIRDFTTKDGKIALNDFKIVYIAPMKALAGEMTRSFGNRLATLGVRVRELTGDTQLSKKEIHDTQMLIVTPEKWDVVTRKSIGDVGLTHLVRLIIFDEIHLLHDDRGPVIETLVARTLRQVEIKQSGIRIVGLSATLPNYCDVARFLRVNFDKGLFYFDGRFRPVPLSQTFIGIKSVGSQREQLAAMDDVCYEKVAGFVRQGHQVLVFVHARNATGKLAQTLREMANNHGDAECFAPDKSIRSFGQAQQAISKAKLRQLPELFQFGFGIHHAGLARSDRILIARLFAEGHIRVLCCTSTLAWGVNLPAHAVVIRGTDVYDAERSEFVDLGNLDVQQIFGRAGRPQFDTSGHGVIITKQSKLYRYVSMLTSRVPIESQFISKINDNLNAEIVLGTVSNVDEAVEWLSHSYFYVRAQLNPLAYGIPYKSREEDPQLFEYRHDLIKHAAMKLDQFQMIRYDETNGVFHSTDLGRIASHYYVKTETIELLNSGDEGVIFTSRMQDDQVLNLLSHAKEFDQLKVREEDAEELKDISEDVCRLPVLGSIDASFGKANCLIQAHIAQSTIYSFSLLSDMAYVAQNVCRLCRAFFEIALRKNWSQSTAAFLTMAICFERRMWPDQCPLRQLTDLVRFEIITKIEAKNFTMQKLCEFDDKELGSLLKTNGTLLMQAVKTIPYLEIEPIVRPITRTILQITLNIRAAFRWNSRHHGRSTQGFWIWIENMEENTIYHHEYFLITKKQVDEQLIQQLAFTIPISDNQLPYKYCVRALSDYWITQNMVVELPFRDIVLPDLHRSHTDLLDLRPLPTSAMQNEALQSLYPFEYFNAVQTQIFHCLYHTDKNALIGAPTGSGKTVAAELAIFKVFRDQPNSKCVYIAPLKALVRERMRDWSTRIEEKLGKRIVELTGDVTPDMCAINNASLIVTTPEKWDGISRSWQTRGYVKNVALIVIDEIHLLGIDRGPVLEVIVARMNLMSRETQRKVRIVGLSTALANAGDVADWLGIEKSGLYNFRPSVRPVPIEVHIAGFPGQHYCPRMASMNKPVFQAINEHSPDKPTLVFVASRRQTRLTAIDLLSLLAAKNSRAWLHMPVEEVETIVENIRDPNLKLMLAFGIGMHHAGLHECDRSIVERLFYEQKIQVLIATATLAWGINMPAHLVVIKGTEYFDGKLGRYVDFPVTDVLQMIGRAGRPQFDDSGVAMVYVQDIKKNFYKKFLYEPFPVESSLQNVFTDHLNAEIVAGTITTKQTAVDYLTWTYLFRRLFANPNYYTIPVADSEHVNRFLTALVDKSVNELMLSSCVELIEDERTLQSLTLGQICSYYYLQHLTVRLFRNRLHSTIDHISLLQLLSDVPEYDEIPVRHNEDIINADLQRSLPIKLPASSMDSPHTKAHLLYQAHFCQSRLLSTDYRTDLKTVLDQSVRIIQAMLDTTANNGWLIASLNVVTLLQMVVQARWHTDPLLCCLPHIDRECARRLLPIDTVPKLQAALKHRGQSWFLKQTLGLIDPDQANQIFSALRQWPIIEIRRVSLNRSSAVVDDDSMAKRVRTSVVLNMAQNANDKLQWCTVQSGSTYVLSIQLARIDDNVHDRRAHAPKFTKSRDAGWLLLIGWRERQELVVLRRIGPIGRVSHVNVELCMDGECGRRIYELILMSDSYLGIDQQQRLAFDIVANK